MASNCAVRSVVIAGGISFLSGCVSGEFVGPMQVSPDGRWIAYLLERTQHFQSGPESIPLRQRIFVCWGQIAEAAKPRCIKVRDRAGAGLIRSRSADTYLTFSPAATYLAVTTPHELLFIELKTGRSYRYAVGREMISSLGWLDDRNVGYVTHESKEGVFFADTRRTFWHQKIFEPVSQRRVIHVDPIVRYPNSAADWPWEYWSPDGRYVLCSSPSRGASAQLLDTATGQVQRQRQDSGTLKAAAWKPDSSTVVWTSYWREHRLYHTYLMTVPDGKVVDLTGKFCQVFGRRQPWYDPLWTADGEFLVCSGLNIPGCLIRPVPWEVRILEKPSGKRGRGVPWASTLRRQPAPGILVMAGPGGEIAVDYEARIIKHLGCGGLTGWTVLPDGKQAVSVQPGNKIVVVPLRSDRRPRPTKQ